MRRAAIPFRRLPAAALWLLGTAMAGAAFGAEVPTPADPPGTSSVSARRYVLVEEFTANTLDAGEIKIGTDLDFGLSDAFMLGTDAVAMAVGATTLQAKALIWESGEHRIALGVRAAYLSKSTLLWGSVNEHFEELDARVIRPSVAWTQELSPRLKLHTFWGKGFGRMRARLSEKGRRKLWETKHPGADYEQRNQETQQPEPPTESEAESGTRTNQEKAASERSYLTAQSLQVQSITGLAQDRFQLAGEFQRASGNKVIVTSRIEQTRLEELTSNFFRLTAAHQWIWTNFQMRLGVGVQYYVMSGRDLDGEEIDEAGVQPASDVAFYWRF